MKNRLWLVAAALAMATSQIAGAQVSGAQVELGCMQGEGGEWMNCAPTVGLMVTDENDRLIDLPGFDPLSMLVQDGKNFSVNGYNYQTSAFSLFLSLTSNPDPFVTYGLAVTNNTNAALNFLFTFSSPYIGGAYSAISSSHSSSFTRSGTTNSLINPYMGSHIHRPFVDGFDVNGAFIATSCVVNTPPASGSCTYPDIMGLPYVTAATGVFGVRVGFTLPANASRLVYTANGVVELGVVPEPSAVLLFAAGLFVMSLVVIQRRRAV